MGNQAAGVPLVWFAFQRWARFNVAKDSQGDIAGFGDTALAALGTLFRGHNHFNSFSASSSADNTASRCDIPTSDVLLSSE